MVKAGGRSNWNNATGADGSSASSKSSSASPSSLTRRFKKGGKRRRRLCYKEGCTLCPSFGYEGSVALSCSRHKKEGMRNLTARRCQHVGCFTAANFGIPGDKPRFCLAHSAEDMVNRNKPRGGEGMGIEASCSSRRTTKASNSVYDGNNTNSEESGMLEAEATADAQASGGILMRTVRSGLGNACEPLSPLSRGSGRIAVTSVVNCGPFPSMSLTSRGHMSQKHSLSSIPVLIPMDPWESVSRSRSVCRTASAVCVSQGDGLDGPSAGGLEEKLPGGNIGVARGGNGRHVCSGNIEEGLKWATVPREPYRHDDVIVAHHVETDDFEKHLPSNGRDIPGGVPDRRGGVSAPFNLNFAGDVGNSGGIMNGGGPSLFMDELNSLDEGDEVESDTGFEIGATLEEILGVEPDDVITDVFDSKENHEHKPLLGKFSDPSVNGSVMLSSAGLSFNELLPTVDSVIGVGEIRNDDGLSLNSCRVNDGGGSRDTVGGGGACLSPPQTRHQDSLGDNNQHRDMGPVPSGNISSPSGSQHNTASSAPLQTRFGLAIVPNGGNSSIAIPLTSASQINMGGDVGVAGGMPPPWSGVMETSQQQGDGGSMRLDNVMMASGNGRRDVWLNGDEISPSKRVYVTQRQQTSLGHPDLVGASSSLPVHVAMGS